MSFHFSANQLEREFAPRRLGNWELPRRHLDRPRTRRAATRVIADDRGHLLPGVQRSCRPPWSRLAGWDLPRLPRQRAATEETESQQPRLTSWEKRSSHVPLTRPLDDEATSLRKGSTQSRNHCRSSAGSGRSSQKGQKGHSSKPLSPLQVTGQATPPVEKPPQVTSSRKNTPPLASSYCSALVARQHAQDNLKHRPLPDVLDDATYRALEACRHARPGLSLDVEPQAAAVGWRGRGVAGPTQCSKLRVYRPKTAASSDGRPSTDVRVESRLPRQDNVSEMQLAICWDVKPPPEQGEPRPSPHIDGSNGSAAPAVFTLVHQTQPGEQPRCGKPGDCSPPERTRPSLDHRGSAGSGPKSAWADKPTQRTTTDGNNNLTEAKESGSPNIRENVANATGRHGSGSSRGRTGSADGRKRAATARNSARNSVDSAESNASLTKQKHHRSSPNLAGGGERRGFQQPHDHYVPGEVACADKKKLLHARPCIACELKASGGSTQERPRSDYKMAFKAGNTGQDYPEHWRLASVYQHAYKPPKARKQPLLASVYQ